MEDVRTSIAAYLGMHGVLFWTMPGKSCRDMYVACMSGKPIEIDDTLYLPVCIGGILTLGSVAAGTP